MRFKLGSKIISLKKQPYFIAEIGVNFENDLKRAKKIIKLAKEGGADAVKFQSYKAEKIACKKSPYYWDLKEVPIKSQYELFKKFDKFGYKCPTSLKPNKTMDTYALCKTNITDPRVQAELAKKSKGQAQAQKPAVDSKPKVKVPFKVKKKSEKKIIDQSKDKIKLKRRIFGVLTM